VIAVRSNCQLNLGLLLAERNLMASAKLTTKGRVTIPAVVRAELKLKAADRIEFVKILERQYEIVVRKLSVKELAKRRSPST